MVTKDTLLAAGGLFQLSDAHRFPPGSQVHRIDSSNSENDNAKKHLIERLDIGHMGFVIPWAYHFLSRLCSLHYHSKNRRFITVNNTCMKDLELIKEMLAKAKNGIDMNLLAF